MVSSYQKSARDTMLIGATTLVTFLIGLFQFPLLIKTLGAYGYGIWSQVMVTTGLILPLVNLGLGYSMVRFLAAETNKREIQEGFYSIISVASLVGLAISLVMLAFAHPIALSFFDGAVQIVRITAAIILVSSLEALYLQLIRTFQQIGKYSIFVIAENCGRIGLIACLVLNGYGIFFVVVSYLALKATVLLILFFLTKSQIGIKRPNFSRLKQYLLFGLPTLPSSIGFWLVNLSDRYVIGYFLGVASVGIYSAGYALGSIPFAVAGVVTFVLLAALSKLYDEGRINEVKTHLSYSLKYLLAAGIPFIFGATILGEPILRVFSTSEIATAGHLVIPLVGLASLLLGAYTIIVHILILAKKTRIMAFIWAVAASVNIGLNILLVPYMGIIAAAITTLIAYSLALGMVSYYAFKEFRFDIDRKFIFKSLAASAVMSVAIWFMGSQGILAVILTVVAGAAIYGAVLLLLKGFKREELQFFARLAFKGTLFDRFFSRFLR